MSRLFGTDGIRGIANKDLTCELAMKIGKSAAIVLGKEKNSKLKILIGKDTRISSDMLEGALISGLCSIGANVVKLGVVPTPTVAFLIKKYNADAGIMISASHNSFEFNGIKLFNSDGYKLPDDLEEEIENVILDKSEQNEELLIGRELGKVSVAEDAYRDYIDYVKSTVPFNLEGMNVALDCANGSAFRTAQLLFSELGANSHILFNKPNGININDNCGSTHMDALKKYVKENNLDLGIAFDGDADRCLAIDEKGNIIDGDFIMAICAADLKSRNKLINNTIVGTVMTNMGFNRFCDDNNLKFISTNVGDRYVLESMLREGYNFGGEQSGHVIFLDYSTTGDGQLTACHLLSVLNRRKANLSSLSTLMKRYPQVIINVKISHHGKIEFYKDKVIKKIIKDAKEKISNTGRVLVRVSGTEPLVRVMLEGEDYSFIEKLAKEIADVIKNRLS